VGRQRDVDALERFHEHRAGAGEVAAPAARPEIPVEGHLDALLARDLDDGKETAESVVGVERKRYPGEIDELGTHQALYHLYPVRQFEQIACWRLIAPIVELAFAGRVGVDDVKAGQPARNAQYEIARDAFRRRERE